MCMGLGQQVVTGGLLYQGNEPSRLSQRFCFIFYIIPQPWRCRFWMWLCVSPHWYVVAGGFVWVCVLMEMFCDLQKYGGSWTGGTSRRAMIKFSKHSWITRSTVIHRSRWFTAQSVERILKYSNLLRASPSCADIRWLNINNVLTVLYSFCKLSNQWLKSNGNFCQKQTN